MEVVHTVITVAIGLIGAIWGVAKYTAGHYQHSIDELDARLKEVEREYITRSSVEATLARMEESFRQGLQRIHIRLDDLYRDIHADPPPLKRHREEEYRAPDR